MAMTEWNANVQDQASVDAWKQRAERLNQQAEQLVKEAGQALAEFKGSAEGQIFDKVVEYSSGVISGTATVLQGMNKILETVNTLVADTKAKIGELVQDVKDVSRRVLGR